MQIVRTVNFLEIVRQCEVLYTVYWVTPKGLVILMLDK